MVLSEKKFTPPDISNHSNLRLSEMMDFTYDDIMGLLKRVGEPYGWDLRQKYQMANAASIRRLLKSSGTHVYYLTDSHTIVGFAWVTDIDADMEHFTDKHPSKYELVRDYAKKQGFFDSPSAEDDFKPVEFNKFGMFPEFASKGYGSFFFPKIIQKLIKQYDNNFIYLDTRSWNRGENEKYDPKNPSNIRVVEFYKRLGFEIVHVNEMPNDLVLSNLQKTAFRNDPSQSSTHQLNLV